MTTPNHQRTLTLLLAAITLTPIALLQTPFLGDTLNHLARMHILAAPTPSQFYEVHWSPIPYLAMDALLPPLVNEIGAYNAGRLFLAACLILPAAATTALHRAIHHRPSLIPAAAFLLSYNELVSLGFLNYLFSASLAVLLFAAWIATQTWPRWPRAAAFAPLVTLLYFGHVFACLAYCLSVAGWEAAQALRARLTTATLANIAAATAQALPAMALAATLDVNAGYVGTLHTVSGTLPDKLTAAISPLILVPDATDVAALLATLLLAAILARHIRLAPTLWPAALLLSLAALAMPHILASTGGTDLRLPLVAALLLIGATSWRPTTPTAKPAFLAALLLLVTAKSADAWRILHLANTRIAQTRQILNHLPPGARLLVVNAPRGTPATRVAEPTTIWHMPEVAIIDHDAFLPTLFTGLSTVHVRPAYWTAATPNGFPITPDQLRTGETLHDQPGINIPDRPDGGGRLYHYGWPDKFDYVLIQRFGTNPGPLPTRLTLTAHSDDLDLYKIQR